MPQCQQFVQNAWKKDLCSNCFKSKEEHDGNGVGDGRLRYLATLIPQPAKASKGILKVGDKPKRQVKGARVIFPAEESKVIGYGGEECVLSDDDEADTVVEPVEETPSDGEHEREMQRLTRSNTDFNTVAANLMGSANGEPKRSFTQLMLGKPLTDAEGRKKTLLVTVQPFGGPEAVDLTAPMTNNRKPSHTKLLDNQDSKKNEIVLKSLVNKITDRGDVIKLDVKTSDTPVSKPAQKNESSNEVIISSGQDEKKLGENNEVKPDVVIKSVLREVELSNKMREGKTTLENEETSRIPLIKSRLEKTKTVIRTSAFNGRADLETKNDETQPKPAMRKSYEMNNKEANIHNEKSSVVLNFIVKDNRISNNNQFGMKSNLNMSAKSEESAKYCELVESNNEENSETNKDPTIFEEVDLQQTNGVGYELDLEPLIETPTQEVTTATALMDDHTSPNAESQNFFNNSKQLESLVANKPDNVIAPEQQEVRKSEETPKKLHTNIYKKLPMLDEQIILKEVSKTASTPPVRQVTIAEAAVKISEELDGEDLEPAGLFPSRELAGEPDGRADSDELSEPPALPSSPPPMLDPRPSFLHGLIKRPLGDKPKVPIKSSKVFQATRKALQQLAHSDKHSLDVTPHDTTSDPLRTPQKRRAPKPPQESTSTSYSLLSKERTSTKSCPTGDDKSDIVSTLPCPEAAPRRSLSLSAESLTPVDEKKKSGKFSIRKFLRLGSSKDMEEKNSKVEEVVETSPKPRPEIIHPLELNGAAVEVVRSRCLEDSSSTSSFGSLENRDNITEVSFDSFSSSSPNSTAGRPSKPPPPPRNQSLDAWGRNIEKPARPPPPKSTELLRKQQQTSGQTSPTTPPVDNVYANLDCIAGEVRSVMTPSKPQRTASIRETASDGPKRKFSAAIQPDDGTYEVVEIRHHDKKSTFLSNPSEGVYESVRHSTDSKGSYVAHQRRSEGSMDLTPDYAKLRAHFPRSTSLPYCASEADSDIYSPYSFYGSEEGGDDEGDYATPGHTWKTNRLRLRKGRSIVHKNLEDNYGAVIIANHEALAQVLEQVNQTAVVPLHLRALKSLPNLRWADFSVPAESRGMRAGRRVFHAAQWGGQNVTLSIAMDQTRLANRAGTFSLTPITEFNDLVPGAYLCSETCGTELVQASVAVFSRLQVDTIQSFSSSLMERSEDVRSKEACFVLLQLVNGLKNLQAQGIEESALNLSSFVLCSDEKDQHPRLCVVPSLGSRDEAKSKGSLCQCAAAALGVLLPFSTPLTTLVTATLTQERAVSLTRVKSLLEFTLWGPGDVALVASASDREQALQRWIDLERATVLHGLVRTRVELTAFEECHLLFLVRTSAKMMCEASFLLDSRRLESPSV